MANHILITGAPGNVGSSLVDILIDHPNLRIGAHDPEFARQTFGESLDIVEFDFLNPATHSAAFHDVDAMFLVRPPALANVRRDIAPAMRAAKAAGVRHIVFISIQGVEHNLWVPHHRIETLIKSLDFRYTFLRCGFFMQNLTTSLLEDIRDRDEISVPVGRGRTAFVDVRDIASVAALALQRQDVGNKMYTLTGSDTLDYYEVTEELSRVLKRRIDYLDPSFYDFLRQELGKDRSFGFAVISAILYTLTRFGNAKEITADVLKVLGRPPITFAEFAKDYKEYWAKPPV